jgi:hypothetical protein
MAWTAAQIGHRDTRLMFGVYTDVNHRRQSPAEKLGALLRNGSNVYPIGTRTDSEARRPKRFQLPPPQIPLHRA